MAGTPLQNGLGRVYGPGKTAKSAGVIPVWLEQHGSRIMGGLIAMNHKVDGTRKVMDFYPTSICTATPFVDLGDHNYCPIPTYRVIEDVSAEATKVLIAKREGLALLVPGSSVALASDPTKKVSISAGNIKVVDSYYELTISAGDFGALKAGDVLVLESMAEKVPLGLSKDNLIYDGYTAEELEKTKLNMVLIDDGRLIADTAAPASRFIRQSLQTVKWEDVFNG